MNLRERYVKLQIKDILESEEKIFIPNYQRAYSWELKNELFSEKNKLILF